MIKEIFEHPIIFEEAKKLDGNNTWVQHIPFAFFLLSYLKPKIVVELGVHTGESYFSFCQGVKILNLDTKCYGIDSWMGDEHTGFYGDSIFNSLLNYQSINYCEISKLIRKQFDESLDQFEEKSIGLLHIDGFHSYEAVKHDFETWLPKMREDGVVLFHDTQVKEREFGVWKLWSELVKIYPSVEFRFSYGLGCILLSKNHHSDTALLLSKMQNDHDTHIFFEKLGQKNLMIGEILRLKYQLSEVKR